MKLIHRPWALPLLVATATFLAFWPCLHAQFVGLDDTNLIVNNMHFRGLTLENLKWMFTGSFNIGVYIPLSWMSLAVDYLVWGMQPFGFHLTNVLLHSLNAVLCFFFIDRLFSWTRQAHERHNELPRRVAAACAALFFAIHPLRVESVAWVVERRDVLSGTFFFLTLLSYLSYCKADLAPQKRRWFGISIAMYVLLLLSKAIGMTMPLLLVLLDMYPLKRHGKWAEKIPFLCLGLFFAALAGHAQKMSGAMWILQDFGIAPRLGLMFHSLFFYTWKTLWPTHLYAIHELPADFQWRDPSYLGSVLGVLFISAVALWKRKEWPTFFYVSLAYVGILLPVSGLFQSGPLMVADHVSYLPCIGWAILFGAALRQEQNLYLKGSAMLVLVGLGLLTWQQCHWWQNAEVLYRHVLEEDPNSFIAHDELGNLWVSEGKWKEGIGQFEAAYKIKPAVPVAFNLAIALEKDGRAQEAARYYSLVIQADPNDVRAYNNLGLLYLKAGFTDAAVICFREALRHQDYSQLHANLELALEEQRRTTSLKSSGSSARKERVRP